MNIERSLSSLQSRIYLVDHGNSQIRSQYIGPLSALSTWNEDVAVEFGDPQ